MERFKLFMRQLRKIISFFAAIAAIASAAYCLYAFCNRLPTLIWSAIALGASIALCLVGVDDINDFPDD